MTDRDKHPDDIAEQVRQQKQAITEHRLDELEEWPLTHPCASPEWDKHVSEYNALTIKQSQLDGKTLHAGTLPEQY